MTIFKKSHISLIAGLALSASYSLASAQDDPYPHIEYEPIFNEAGELLQPVDFRELIFIGSPLTPNGLNGGNANFPEYHNVYTQPEAFKYYRANGEWPEGTMMIKELQLVKESQYDDGSRIEPSGRGYFPGPVNGMDVSVKDSTRYAESQNWGYFNFGHHAPPYSATAAAAPVAACAGCHIANADEDMVYMNLYSPIVDPLPLPEAAK